MCGIAGIANFDGRPVDRDVLRDMVDIVGYRGPDACGTFIRDGVGFGHARLSIIDVSGGRQPMSNADGSLWITFNGEIFNYVELRDHLISKGHHFETRSDTEVILHMYEEEGIDCVQHFNGQWAFAIWDAPRKRLFLSRDRVGVRPLHYAWSGTSFVFASEIKSLFSHPGLKREFDPVALAEIFTFWCTLPPRTFFRDIYELPPGHSLLVEGGTARVQKYWSLDFDPDSYTTLNEDHCAEQLWDMLQDAVRLRLRADVPVGSYLSGGLDSSTITALINQITPTQLRTFSVAFADPEFDESLYQDDVVHALNTRHTRIQCSYDDIAGNFADVLWHTEKPILRTAPVPLYLLSRLVKQQGYKVVLTGEGADEMLGGYDIFKEAKVRLFCAKIPESKLRPMMLRRLYPYLNNLQKQPDSYLRAFFRVRPEDMDSSFFSHIPRWELTAKLQTFFSDTMVETLRGYDPLDELRSQLPDNFMRWDRFCQAQYLEAQYLMPGYILSSQGDRVAMAHSVEIRLPFLDHRVVRFAATLPPRMKMKVLNEKYLLKRCAAKILPASVSHRPKQPYRAPDGRSFFKGNSGGVNREVLSPRALASADVFNPRRVGALVDKFQNGQGVGVKDDMALVGILSTQILLQQFVTGFRRSQHAAHREGVATIHQ